jgi:hypothetical protein
MQRHRLLGDRGPQPLDLGLQFGHPLLLGRLAATTRHTVTTVDRSTLYRLAASLWVACPVSTETHNSYFSLGGRCRFGLRATGPAPLVLLIFGFDTCTDLPVAQARRQPVG